MKNSKLIEINKEELIDTNGGGIPFSFNFINFFAKLEEAERNAAELRSIR